MESISNFNATLGASMPTYTETIDAGTINMPQTPSQFRCPSITEVARSTATTTSSLTNKAATEATPAPTTCKLTKKEMTVSLMPENPEALFQSSIQNTDLPRNQT